MNRLALAAIGGALAAALFGAAAQSPAPTKKELVQRVLKSQESEIEGVARSIVERPAAQLMQQADLAIRGQMAPEKREQAGKAVEAEVKKYVEETYPLVRERALRLAPTTAGAVMEEKLTLDELKQLVAWLESPVNRKFQQLGPDIRGAFLQKLLADARPVVEPKVLALDGRIRTAIGAKPAGSEDRPAPDAAPQRPAPPAPRASGK